MPKVLVAEEVPENSRYTLDTPNQPSALGVIVREFSAPAATVPFAQSLAGSAGAAYPADDTETWLLGPFFTPAEVSIAAVTGDRILVECQCPFSVEFGASLIMTMIASDDGFFGSQQTVNNTEFALDASLAGVIGWPLMRGYFEVPSDGTWSFRIQLLVAASPGPANATWFSPGPLAMTLVNYGQP